MKFKIPATFTLIDKTYTVIPMPAQIADYAGVFAFHHNADSTIVISDDLEGDDLRHYFCHELCHALLEAVGKEDLSQDESLVDLMGAVLNQFIMTAEGNFENNKQ